MQLNQITVPSTNIARSIAFYERLGLELIVHSSDSYARFVCPSGNSTFSIHYVGDAPIDNGIWVYFEMDNLDERVNELINDGFVFEEMPKDQVWLWREARLKDPDGNQLILYFAGENRLNPPWKIKR